MKKPLLALLAVLFIFAPSIVIATTLTTYTQPVAIQVQAASATGATSASVTFTQTPTPNDLVICVAATNAGSGATFTWPSGFTALGTQQNVSTSLGAAMAYRVVQSGDGSSYTVTASASVGAIVVGCKEFAYVNTSQPIMSSNCFTDATPGTTENTPNMTPTAPTVATSFFASVGNTTVSPQAGTYTNFDQNVSSGLLIVHDQHSAPIYAFQNGFSASISYGTAPSAAVGCAVLINPTITPFTVSAVNVVASSTPVPTPTLSPTPTPSPGSTATPIPNHVLTGEYLNLNTTEINANPATYAPYLTWAYTKGDHELSVHNAGIKVVEYQSALMPQNGQTSQTLVNEYSLAAGTYNNAMATTCTSATKVTAYSGIALVANVLGSYSNGSGSIVNAAPFITADYASAQSYLSGANSGSSAIPDGWYEDNGTDYPASVKLCGDTSQAVWAQGIANSFTNATLPAGKPLFINSLGVWTMTWAQAQQYTLTSPNIAGGQFESCYGGHHWNSTITGDYISGTDKDWLEAEYGEINTTAKHKIFWCYNKNVGDGASDLAGRLYMYASFLLTYDSAYTIYQTANATSPSQFKVFPETGLVPSNPTIKATDISQLKTNNIYEQDYGDCHYRGTDLGACSVYVNPDPANTYAIPPNTYANSAVLSGDGVLDGGTMTFYGSKPTTLPPTSAAILVHPSSTAYMYQGCKVWNGDASFFAPITNTATDTNSANIISHMASGTFAAEGDTDSQYHVNLATASTPVVTAVANDGRNPPVYGNDNVPWSPSFYIETGGDHHAFVLRTDTCQWWEMYLTHYTSGTNTLDAYAGDSAALATTNFATETYPTTVAYLWYMGLADWGEDASLGSVNHPIAVAMVGSNISNTNYTGYSGTAGGASNYTCSGYTACLLLGDRIAYTGVCNYSGAAQLLCNQLKNYGAIVSDGASGYQLRIGDTISGTDPWSSVYSSFLNNITIANFRVVQRGTIH